MYETLDEEYIPECQIDNKAFPLDLIYSLSNISPIGLIKLYGDNITNSHLKYLTGICIQEIYLCDCQSVTDNGLCYLQHVKEITLDHLFNITDKGLMYLTHACKVKLYHCYAITNGGIKYLSNASKVDINACFDVDCYAYAYLSQVKK